MWLERFVIIVTSLDRDFVPSSWGMYYPTRWDFLTYFGTIGLFLTLFFLFIRFVPMISMFEVRTLLPQAKVEHGRPRRGARRRARADPRRTEADDMHATSTTRATSRRDGGVRLRRRRCVDAARTRPWREGFTKVEAYSPVPIEELNDIIHKKRTHPAEVRPGRRADRHGDRVRAAVLGVGDRVPDEHRRPAAGELDRRSSSRRTS